MSPTADGRLSIADGQRAEQDVRAYVRSGAGLPFTVGRWYRLLEERGRFQVSPADPALAGLTRGPLGQCYRNASERARPRRESLAPPAHMALHYVQGVATTGLIPVDHAWLEDDGGTVYDPTWPRGLGYLGVIVPPALLDAVQERTGKYGELDVQLLDALRAPAAAKVDAWVKLAEELRAKGGHA